MALNVEPVFRLSLHWDGGDDMRKIFVSDLIKSIAKGLRRRPDSHKGNYGKVLIIAGSRGMSGAAVLAGAGALRGGCGLLKMAVPEIIADIVDVKLTEAITFPLSSTSGGGIAYKNCDFLLGLAAESDFVVIGPGLGSDSQTVKLVRKFLKNVNTPVLIDADGLNALEGEAEILAKIKSSAIITPHIGEFSRLFGISKESVRQAKSKVAVNSSLKYNVDVVLKGYKTVVASGKKFYVNYTGNPGLSVGGSGDLLAGLIAGFGAQLKDLYKGAVLGVFVHGFAADIAVKDFTQLSLLPSDLGKYIAESLKVIGVD